jgi:hypothetical protein
MEVGKWERGKDMEIEKPELRQVIGWRLERHAPLSTQVDVIAKQKWFAATCFDI